MSNFAFRALHDDRGAWKCVAYESNLGTQGFPLLASRATLTPTAI